MLMNHVLLLSTAVVINPLLRLLLTRNVHLSISYNDFSKEYMHMLMLVFTYFHHLIQVSETGLEPQVCHTTIH